MIPCFWQVSVTQDAFGCLSSVPQPHPFPVAMTITQVTENRKRALGYPGPLAPVLPVRPPWATLSRHGDH